MERNYSAVCALWNLAILPPLLLVHGVAPHRVLSISVAAVVVFHPFVEVWDVGALRVPSLTGATCLGLAHSPCIGSTFLGCQAVHILCATAFWWETQCGRLPVWLWLPGGGKVYDVVTPFLRV